MTVSVPSSLKSVFNASLALGDKVVSSDALFEIEGHEEISLLIKQFPFPVLSSTGEIEVALPNGQLSYQPQQLKTAQQGSITLVETVKGHIAALMTALITNGKSAKFNAKIYEGYPDNITRILPIYNAFMVLDNPDRDFENRGQLMMISGTIFFSYFNGQ